MTDVGVIPEDWEVKSIGEICCDTKYGVAAEAIPFDGINKYIRITDIDDEDGHFVQGNLTSPSFFMPIHILGENDLLIARTGASVGKSYLYNKQDGKLIFAGFLMKFNINKANPKLVFYKTMTSDYHDYIESESMRSGQPGVNIQQIKDYTVSLPKAIKEQQSIADALTKVDNLITSLTKVIEKKKLIKKGAMQKLLSGEMRLDGFEGEWKQIELCKESSFERGWGLSKEKISDNGSYNCILYGEIFTKYNYVAKTGFSKTNIKEGTPSLYGDIVLPGSTTTCGIDLVKAVAILKNNILLGGDVNIIRFDLKKYDPIFMAYYLSEINKDRIEELTKGITIIHLHISDLKNVIIDIPPTKAEQTAIAKVLTTMDDEIEALEKERDKYKCIKQGMMQQLLTGKIRLICQ